MPADPGNTYRSIEAYLKDLEVRQQLEKAPCAAVFMLGSEEVLSIRYGNHPWIVRVRCELPTRPLGPGGMEEPVRATYIGANSNEDTQRFAAFVEAMRTIDVFSCVHLKLAKPSARALAHLEESDIVCLGDGPHVLQTWRMLSLNEECVLERVKWRYYTGAVLIGLGTGCQFLGQRWWVGEPRHELESREAAKAGQPDPHAHQPIEARYWGEKATEIVPCLVAIDDAQAEALAELQGAGALCIVLPPKGSLIFNVDGCLEPCGALLCEYRYDWKAKEVRMALLSPPDETTNVLACLSFLERRTARRQARRRRAIGLVEDAPLPEDAAGDPQEEGEEEKEEEEGEEGEEGAMASEADVPDGGVEALLAMSALVNAAIKVRNPGKARESGRGLPRVSVKEGRAGASGKLPKGVAPASKRAPTSAPTAQRTASAGAELGSGAALARIGSISGDRGGGRAEAELSFEPMHLELTNVKPQWLMVQLTQNTVQGARRRVKSLPDAWLGVHLANRPTACIGDAERCCPITKLSPGGQLCIRQADLAGLADGLYQFALYSRHLCVASTLAIRFRQNRFTDEIYEPNCEPADDEEPTMAPAEGKRRRGAGGAKRQRVTSRSARRAKGAKVRRAAGSLAADAEDDAEEEVSDLGGGESEEGEGEEEDERPNPLLAAVTALASGRGLGAEEVDEPEDEGHAAASSGGAPEDDEAEGEVDEEAGGHADAEMEAEAADGDELAAAEEGAVMGRGLAAQSDEDGVMGAVLGAVMDED